MENTKEWKVKFLSLYYGQKVLLVSNDAIARQEVGNYFIHRFIEKGILELKLLSSISYEDAIEVAKICGWVSEKDPKEYIKWILDLFDDRFLGDRFSLIPELPIYTSIELLDFLRSKSIALPFMGADVETLVSWGWIKIKTD